MECPRDLADRAFVEIPHPYDISVRRRQMVYRLQQDAHQLPTVERPVEVRACGGPLGPERRLAVRFRCGVTGLVTYHRADPPAGGRTAPVLVQLLQHDDPALLQGISGGRIVAGDPPGDGQEPRRAAPQPCLGIPVEQRAPDRFFQGRCHARERLLRPRHSALPPALAAR